MIDLRVLIKTHTFDGYQLCNILQSSNGNPLVLSLNLSFFDTICLDILGEETMGK